MQMDNELAEDKLLDYSQNNFRKEKQKVSEKDQDSEHYMAYIKISPYKGSLVN